MSHQYRLPVQVEAAPDGSPHRFMWRGQCYHIAEVYSTWHLRDRWWKASDLFSIKGASDRMYYRVRCEPDLLCELYFDSEDNVWVLDHAID